LNPPTLADEKKTAAVFFLLTLFRSEELFTKELFTEELFTKELFTEELFRSEEL
jgi:hypothetical protein